MTTTIAVVLFAVFLALCVAAGYWAFKPLFEKKENTPAVAHQPTERVMNLQLDYRLCGAVTLREFGNWIDQFESTITGLHQFKEGMYQVLAWRFWTYHAFQLRLEGLSNEEILQELQSWTVVVSATGRAHHALEDGKGVHCTRKMHRALMAYRSKVGNE